MGSTDFSADKSLDSEIVYNRGILYYLELKRCDPQRITTVQKKNKKGNACVTTTKLYQELLLSG